MKTIEITLYKFEELTSEAQQTAISKNLDFNVDYDWWDAVYEDAANVGIEINTFDLDRNSISGSVKDTEQTAHDITKEHGEMCDTYKIARAYLDSRDSLIENWPKDENGDYIMEGDLDEQLDDMSEEFEAAVIRCYIKSLRTDYEYLTSEGAIKESLISNDYDFTESGEIY